MIETIIGWLPNSLQTKLGMRIIYTISSFVTARAVAFLTGDYLAKILGEVMEQAGHIGIGLTIKVNYIHQDVLQASITGVLMIAGEYFIEKFHESKVLPVVAPEAQQAAQAATPPKGE